MKTIRVAVNGAGRIGRAFIKLAQTRPEIELVAINDLGDAQNIAYLIKYDSVYGKAPFAVSVRPDGKAIVLDGREILFIGEKELAKLPWRDLNVDVVVESTGLFASYEKAKVHLEAGAKRVVVTAPMKDDPTPGIEGATVLMGVNDEKLATCAISSNASCTTNAGSPLIAILDEAIGIEKAVLNTVHGYTATQSLVDGPSKRGFREGRAAAHNIVPSSTGAAIAVTKAFTKLEGLFDGVSMRVPIIAGSIVDVTFIAKRNTSKEEVNDILRRAAENPRWKGIFSVTEEPLVSSDILGSSYGSIADLEFTRVIGGNLVKVCAWYDNEMGYTYTLVEHVIKTGSHII
ncbi:aldehyde dehydrogenase [Patescibacteria group bacterium]|nr:MAG: aldehyde dehydrogenase [Patescibacteria group bacterium]